MADVNSSNLPRNAIHRLRSGFWLARLGRECGLEFGSFKSYHRANACDDVGFANPSRAWKLQRGFLSECLNKVEQSAAMKI